MSEVENRPSGSKLTPFYDPMHQVIDSEVDFRVIFSVLWKGKWWVSLFALLSGLVGGSYAFLSADIYESQVLIAPVSNEQMSASSMLASQFGGLSSLAGIHLGGGNMEKTILALQVLQSRKFLGDFIKRHDLMVAVMAIKGWDKLTDKFRYKTNIYNPQNNQWLIDDEGERLEPSMLEAIEHFIKKIMLIHSDSATGMVTVSIHFYSPFIAQQWATLLIADLNDEIRQQDMLEAQERINYLNQQLTKTNIADSRNMIYQLIEQQMKTLMLTNVSKEYVFKTVDPPVKNIEPIKPNKLMVISVSFLFGIVVGIVFIFIRKNVNA